MIILLGSTRAAKVEGARDAIEAIASRDPQFRDAVVQPVDVADLAPTMPMTEAAIIAGAHARAAALLARHPVGRDEPFFAIGVEGGIDPIAHGDGSANASPYDGRSDGRHDEPVRYALKTWAAVTDGARWGYGAGGAVLLPEEVAREVAGGRELGDVIDRLAAAPVRATRGAWGVLTLDLVTRRDAFTLAIVAALAPFYNPALYGTLNPEP